MEAFESSWAHADSLEIPAGVVIRYRVLRHPTMSAEELAALEARVEGAPDHPDRAQVEEARRRLEQGPDETAYEVWYSRSGRWRYNTTWLYDGTYFDAALTERASWGMTQAQLSVMDPGRAPPPGRDYSSLEGEFGRHYRLLVCGGMQAGRPIGMRPARAGVRDGVWSGVASAGDRLEIELRGRYSAEAGRVLPDQYRYSASARSPEVVGKSWTMTGWRHDGVLDEWIASRVDVRDPSGVLIESVVYDGSEPLDEAEFGAVTATPTTDGVDPARGAAAFGSVLDFRPGRETRVRFTDEGPQARPLTASEIGLPARRLRVGGWVVAGVIGVGLGVLVVRRRSLGVSG